MLYPLIVMDDDMVIAIAEKMATSGTPTSWLPSTLSRSSSKASFKASKITRNSSPSKQLRNAELEETGFLRADLRNDTKPGLLDALTTELEKIGGGSGILPKNLQEDLADQRSIAAWNFGESPELKSHNYLIYVPCERSITLQAGVSRITTPNHLGIMMCTRLS
ncbi:hypothetical protein BDW66DRAFT_60623 [Aspergillus desertorum]